MQYVILAILLIAVGSIVSWWWKTSRKMDLQDPRFKEFVSGQVAVLRPMGFFRQYSGMSDEQVTGNLIERVRDEYGTQVGRLVSFPVKLAALDESRVYWGDTEMDISKGNDMYVELLQDLSRISDGKFRPQNIREEWADNEKSLIVSFTHGGQLYEAELTAVEDWMDEAILTKISESLEGTGYDFRMPDADYGQDFALVFLSEQEAKRLEREAGWTFMA